MTPLGRVHLDLANRAAVPRELLTHSARHGHSSVRRTSALAMLRATNPTRASVPKMTFFSFYLFSVSFSRLIGDITNQIKEFKMTHNNYHTEVQDRITSRCEISSPGGCWLYTGSTAGNGYGRMSYQGSNEYTHRVAAVIYLGFDRDSGKFVLHFCDEPSCFNPEHLFTGTQKDNMRDAVAKGRMTGKKLRPDQVAVIKYGLSRRKSQRSLALEYGVSTTAIGQIARGDTWRSVDPASPEVGEGDVSERASDKGGRPAGEGRR